MAGGGNRRCVEAPSDIPCSSLKLQNAAGILGRGSAVTAASCWRTPCQRPLGHNQSQGCFRAKCTAGPTCLCAMRGQYLDRRAFVTLVRPDVSVTRSASNKGSLQSYRPRLSLSRKDQSNHQSNSRLTRRYPSRSPHRLSPPNVGTPLRGCHRRICPPPEQRPGRTSTRHALNRVLPSARRRRQPVAVTCPDTPRIVLGHG